MDCNSFTVPRYDSVELPPGRQIVNFQIVTQSRRPDGIFGELFKEDGETHFGFTLEHAFLVEHQGEGLYDYPSWEPVIPRGKTFRCQRGWHTLDNGTRIESFEVTGIVGHFGVIFHPLNYNRQSKACIGLGDDIVPGEDGWWIKDSGIVFKAFMALQKGANEFFLDII
jgi:hypothetical protein